MYSIEEFIEFLILLVRFGQNSQYAASIMAEKLKCQQLLCKTNPIPLWVENQEDARELSRRDNFGRNLTILLSQPRDSGFTLVRGWSSQNRESGGIGMGMFRRLTDLDASSTVCTWDGFLPSNSSQQNLFKFTHLKEKVEE